VADPSDSPVADADADNDTDHPAVGRSSVSRDALDPQRATALQALLGMPGHPAAGGDRLMPLGHHVYFWEILPPWSMGFDGRAAPGSGFLPDLDGLPQRSLAGGAVFWHAPLILGQEATRHSRVAAVKTQAGEAGPGGLVATDHGIEQAGATVLTERQTLLYRAAASPVPIAANAPPAPDQAETAIEDPALFDAVTLFRYAALTCESHRIHYDAEYARTEEGYAERVVPAGLMAQRLALMAEAQIGPLMRFSFRVAAPLCLGDAAGFCSGPRDGPRLKLWVKGPGDRLCLSAEAEAAG
jgi:3-methylfumaryl-CoA hydratase